VSHPWAVALVSMVVWLLLAMSCMDEVLSVEIDQGDVELVVWESVQLSATVSVRGSASSAVRWSSGDRDVAVVSREGRVTALREGSSTVTATSAFDDTKHASVAVTVGPKLDLELCGTISRDRTLDIVGTPYVLCRGGASVTDGATLRIEPGVTVVSDGGTLQIRMAYTNFATKRFHPAGVIVAVGTADAPIRFTGAVAEPGSWGGIWITSGDELNRLSFVEVADGGLRDRHNLELTSEARVTITDSVFRNALGYGLFVGSGSVDLPGFARNAFHGNSGAAIRMNPQHMPFMDGASTFDANGVDAIEIRSGTLTGPHTYVWPSTTAPFWLAGSINVDTRVEVAPGFQAVASGSWIRVRSGGTIVAVGTRDEPISFTGYPPEPGAWSGVRIESDSPDNEFRHVDIAHGGGGTTPYHNITLSAVLTLTGSTIRDSAACGIWLGRNAALSEFDNTFFGNASGDICP
jgi:hypothetical protein